MTAAYASSDTPSQRGSCRSCRHTGLQPVLDLGMMPLADALVDPARADEPQPKYPLRVAFCPACSLVQILESAPAELLYASGFAYYSSFSDSLLAHAAAHAAQLIERRKLDPRSFVLEIASNDGYMLRNFIERGIEVLGIDPAEGPAQAAIGAGVPTRLRFFTAQYADQLRDEGVAADVIIANNVLAHVPDPNDLVAGTARVLKDGGIAVFEFPYVRDLIDKVEFDTIYHEHHCYFSVTAIDALFRRHGLQLIDAERLAIHGGSLRVSAAHDGAEAAAPSVGALLDEERAIGLTEYGYYGDFARRVERLRADLRRMLTELKSHGASIAAYGAAAKGAVLLNAVGIGRHTIDFVVDRNVYKQGMLMPGVAIPIDEPARLLEKRPDYVLMLAWNFADEIIAQQRAYLESGGRFIIPIPTPRILETVAVQP